MGVLRAAPLVRVKVKFTVKIALCQSLRLAQTAKVIVILTLTPMRGAVQSHKLTVHSRKLTVHSRKLTVHSRKLTVQSRFRFASSVLNMYSVMAGATGDASATGPDGAGSASSSYVGLFSC